MNRSAVDSPAAYAVISPKRRTGLLIYVFAAIAALLLIAFTEPYTVRLSKESVFVDGLDDGLEGLKLAYISDVHVKGSASLSRLKKAVVAINAQSVDLVCLGGDYADTREYAEAAFDALDGLDAPVYAVRGNHDFSCDIHEIMREHNVSICDNAGFWFEKSGARLRVMGVDDYIKGRADAKEALGDALGNDAVLLLAHNPLSTEDVASQIDPSAIDFALCGHTHGGQITFFGLWGPLGDRRFPAFSSQWQTRHGIKTLYSNGLGTTFVPMRFMAPPQIHILTLTSKK